MKRTVAHLDETLPAGSTSGPLSRLPRRRRPRPANTSAADPWSPGRPGITSRSSRSGHRADLRICRSAGAALAVVRGGRRSGRPERRGGAERLTFLAALVALRISSLLSSTTWSTTFSPRFAELLIGQQLVGGLDLPSARMGQLVAPCAGRGAGRPQLVGNLLDAAVSGGDAVPDAVGSLELSTVSSVRSSRREARSGSPRPGRRRRRRRTAARGRRSSWRSRCRSCGAGGGGDHSRLPFGLGAEGFLPAPRRPICTGLFGLRLCRSRAVPSSDCGIKAWMSSRLVRRSSVGSARTAIANLEAAARDGLDLVGGAPASPLGRTVVQRRFAAPWQSAAAPRRRLPDPAFDLAQVRVGNPSRSRQLADRQLRDLPVVP